MKNSPARRRDVASSPFAVISAYVRPESLSQGFEYAFLVDYLSAFRECYMPQNSVEGRHHSYLEQIPFSQQQLFWCQRCVRWHAALLCLIGQERNGKLMLPEQLDLAFAKSISQLLEDSEAAFGNHHQWEFYRHVLLKHLNGLKRQTARAFQEREGKEYGEQCPD